MKPTFESIPRQEAASFVAYWRREPQFAFDWHYHPEIELTYIHRGHGTRLVGDHLSEFQSGDLVLLGENLPHTWATRENPEQEASPAEAIVIQIPLRSVSAYLQHNPEFRSIAALLDLASRGVCFSGLISWEIGEKMAQLLEVSGLTRLTSLWLLLERLSRSNAFELLASPFYAPSHSRENEARLDRAFQLIHREFTRPLPLAELAALTHMTESSFSRFFKKMTRRSFSDYLTELRIARACQLLTETRLPIGEVAFSSGFNSTTHFNRMFLRKKGVSPRDFRKR